MGMQRYWGRIKTLQFSQGWEQSNVLMEINCLEYYFISRWLIEKNCIRSNCKASVNEPKLLFTLQDSSFSVSAAWAEYFLCVTADQRTGRNDARVRKGSGRAVTVPVRLRYCVYHSLSSGTEVTHHLHSLIP